ncbi:heterokaryon incompatibility protein-domain-containing protein, partial [Pestalotiopsis sp. NC0098]
KEESVYMVLVTPKGSRRINSDAYAASAKESHFLGRGLVDNKEKQALMKSWIDICVEKHGANCRNTDAMKPDFKKLIRSTFFGVVDVVDMQLKPLPIVNGKPERYVALSYVWGKSHLRDKPYTTTRANVMTRIQHGGLENAWERLPRTIQETILLVARLGERYVWIDSLCIVQDSVTSWELNAKAMHLVYGNAHFTICAADGDADAGLRASSSTLHLPPLTAECLPNVRLLVSRPPEAVIEDSMWNKRGWTFQERLLSHRCLIFAEGQVYFQCRSTVMSQHIFTDGGVNGWSLDWTNAPLRTLGELPRRAFWFYMKCVPLYTGRTLTKPKDILTAFQGTSWLLQHQMNAFLFYGLPSSHFDLALLWMGSKQLDRRRQTTEDDGYGGKEFPSWSWSGWIGGKSEYPSNMIEGCLSNVQEWLRDHTWIRWYVRDYEGNLRPLWDKDVLSEDQSTEKRWRGYAGRESHFGAGVDFEPLPSFYRDHTQSRPQPPYTPGHGGFAPMKTYQRAYEPSYPQLGNDAEIAEEWSDLDIHVLRRSDYSQNGRSDHSSQDNFGRPIRSTVKNLNADSFEGILPDNPFSVIRGPFPAKSKDGIRAMPILQLFTWQIELLVVRRQEDEVSSPAPGDLCHYSIVDKKGDWCGSIVLSTKLKGGSDVRPSIFIALSDAKTMTEEECPVWNYYIPKAREESEWDLYYVMMLERNHERALWERVAIGKVFQAAFRDASWSEIKLG